MSSGKWQPFCLGLNVLTHSGLVMYNAPINSVIIDSQKGSLPAWHKVITYTKADIFSIALLGTNISAFPIIIRWMFWNPPGSALARYNPDSHNIRFTKVWYFRLMSNKSIHEIIMNIYIYIVCINF